MGKRAIILAGGKGTRLKPYAISLPKPLVPIGNMPVLEIIIRQLAHFGFDHITITVNHLAEIIKAFCGNGEKWNIKIDYTFEEIQLSTMGPLTLVPNLPDNFLVMNGDVLTDLDLEKFFQDHVISNNLFTISSYEREQIVDFGVLESKQNILCGFREKPVLNYTVSMGVYMLNKEVIKYIPQGIPYGFDNLMVDLINKEIEVKIIPHHGYWLDIGRPDDYEKAIHDVENNTIKI